MNNLSKSMKKLMGNKNTVTIIGVILCIGILYWGYNKQINQKVEPTRVPYAKQTIQPRTEITSDMIGYMDVPAAFIKEGSYYRDAESIIGKYSNYNSIIAEGSIFYEDLIIDKSILPNSAFINIKDNETPINYKVNMDSTYANSMMPDDYIDIYFKGVSNEGNIMFGKFISNIKILAVKDAEGKHVFENNVESRTPAYMMFALPEDMHLLFRKAIYLQNTADIEITLVPNTQEITKKDTVYISSEDIKKFIEERTQGVDESKILSETSNQVVENTEQTNKEETENTTNNNGQ